MNELNKYSTIIAIYPSYKNKLSTDLLQQFEEKTIQYDQIKSFS